MYRNSFHRKVQIIIDKVIYYIRITRYRDGSNNIAVELEEKSQSYYPISINPGYELAENTLLILNKPDSKVKKARQALLDAGIIQMVEPLQEVNVLSYKAKLYQLSR